MSVRARLFPIILFMVFLSACNVKRVWYRLQPEEEVWFQQDTEDDTMRSDLASCNASVSDTNDVADCMQAKGYLFMPKSVAELLMVRSLERKGHSQEEIVTELGLDRKQVRRLTDEDHELRHIDSLGRQPVEVLASIGKPAVRSLIAGLESPDPLVRRQSAEALGEIGDKRAVEPLIDLLSDKDKLIRRHAVKALGRIGDPRAVAPLTELLADAEEAWHIRASVAEALGRIADPGAIEWLTIALTDSHWNVRSESAKALGQTGDQRAVEPLILSLQDPDAVVRSHVAEALGAINDERAVDPLRKAMEDKDRNVRKQAQQALMRIIGEGSPGP